MINIYVTYSDTNDLVKINNLSNTISVTSFNSLSKTDKKKSYTLKSHWAARLDPFAIVYEDDKPIKAFYSEADENVIDTLIAYLKNNNLL